MLTGLFDTMSVHGAVRLDDIAGLDSETIATGHKVETRQLRLRSRGENAPSIRLLTFEAEELMRRAVQLIPAEPSWNVVAVQIVNDEIDAWTEPLIAWALCFDGAVRPVGTDGVVPDRATGVWVQSPDGKVHSAGEWVDPAGAESIAQLKERIREQRGRTIEQVNREVAS